MLHVSGQTLDFCTNKAKQLTATNQRGHRLSSDSAESHDASWPLHFNAWLGGRRETLLACSCRPPWLVLLQYEWEHVHLLPTFSATDGHSIVSNTCNIQMLWRTLFCFVFIKLTGTESDISQSSPIKLKTRFQFHLYYQQASSPHCEYYVCQLDLFGLLVYLLENEEKIAITIPSNLLGALIEIWFGNLVTLCSWKKVLILNWKKQQLRIIIIIDVSSMVWLFFPMVADSLPPHTSSG